MSNPLPEIRRLLEGAQRVLIVSHVSPDGDTVGAALGLAWALRAEGKEVRLACADPIPLELTFLPGARDFSSRRAGDEEIIFCLDASDPARLGAIYDAEAFRRVPVVNLDHHITNTLYGDIQWVLPLASTAEIVLEVIRGVGLPLDRTVATCLLAGVVTDTRGFRTPNTTPETLRRACDLMEAGAPLAEITEAVFDHRALNTLRVWGAVLSRMELEGGLLWAELPLALLEAYGVSSEASKGLVNFMSTCAEAEITALLREMENGQGVDVGLRARPGYDVSAVALAFGGGGHPQAAGCQLRGSLQEAKERLLPALKALIAQKL